MRGLWVPRCRRWRYYQGLKIYAKVTVNALDWLAASRHISTKWPPVLVNKHVNKNKIWTWITLDVRAERRLYHIVRYIIWFGHFVDEYLNYTCVLCLCFIAIGQELAVLLCTLPMQSVNIYLCILFACFILFTLIDTINKWINKYIALITSQCLSRWLNWLKR